MQCATFWLDVFYEQEIKYERNDKKVIFSLFFLWDEMASLFTICSMLCVTLLLRYSSPVIVVAMWRLFLHISLTDGAIRMNFNKFLVD